MSIPKTVPTLDMADYVTFLLVEQNTVTKASSRGSWELTF